MISGKINKNARLIDIDTMKVLLTLLVVIGHVFTNYAPYGLVKPYYSNDIFVHIVTYIYSFHMPAFVAVSGAIYYYVRFELNKYNNRGEYLKNKVKRLLLPYCFFSVFILFPVLWLINVVKTNPMEFFYINYILSQDPRHLWYVLMLFWVMLIFRISDRFANRFYIPILFVCLVLNICSGYLPNYFQSQAACTYMIYFYLGYLFMYKRHFFQKYISRRNLIVFFLINLMLWYIYNWYNVNVITERFLKLIAAISGMSFIYIMSDIVSRTNIVKTKAFATFSKNSYAIYLFHPAIIYMTIYFTKEYPINSYILFLTIFVVAVSVSYCLANALRICCLKWALGE